MLPSTSDQLTKLLLCQSRLFEPFRMAAQARLAVAVGRRPIRRVQKRLQFAELEFKHDASLSTTSHRGELGNYIHPMLNLALMVVGHLETKEHFVRSDKAKMVLGDHYPTPS